MPFYLNGVSRFRKGEGVLLTHLERLNRFLDDVPEDFLRDITEALGTLYPRSYDETSELPSEYQRYMRPHLLRTQAEIAVLTVARRYELATEVKRNRSADAHARVMTDSFSMTLSRTPGPSVPPRWAKFREDYSKVANFWLPVPEFEDEQQPVEVREDAPRLFAVISHGPKFRQWRDLGFVYANFLRPDGSYTGEGINLVARFAQVDTGRADEDVREPEFGFDAGEDTGNGESR